MGVQYPVFISFKYIPVSGINDHMAADDQECKLPVRRWIILGNLMYTIVIIVNSTILYSWKLLTVNLKCSHHKAEHGN